MFFVIQKNADYIATGISTHVTYTATVNEYTQAFEITKTVTNAAGGHDQYRVFNLLFTDGQELKFNDSDPAGTFDETQAKYPAFS